MLLPLCMQRKMRFPKSSIVCFLKHQVVTSPPSSNPTAHLNITRSSCVKCSKKHNVQEQLPSNEHQQFQNGRAEKLVDSIGRKIRGMLVKSQMPPEFWGAAVVLATDLYIVVLAWNHLIITGITSSLTFNFCVL